MISTKGFLVLLLVGFLSAATISMAAEESDSESVESPQPARFNAGLIFNITDFLNIESYHGGLGFKFGSDILASRFLVDFFYSNRRESFEFDLGAALEFHFIQGRVSPYLGGVIEVGYSSQREGSQFMYIIPLSLGALLGVEIFVFDFLSLFAEYGLNFGLDIITSEYNSTRDVDNQVVFNLGIGNNSKIGITIYFTRIGKTELQ